MELAREENENKKNNTNERELDIGKKKTKKNTFSIKYLLSHSNNELKHKQNNELDADKVDSFLWQ